MSIREVVPALEATCELLTKLHENLREIENDDQFHSFWPDFTLRYGGELIRIADQVRGQVRTAERRYTIAVVGEFNTGKSTVLNAILGLSGGWALSTEDTPDTAVSTVLSARDQGGPEACLIFADEAGGQHREDTTWERARQLTSQVWIDKHPEDQRQANSLIEIQYFLENELLQAVNFNDLPGTGSRYWLTHTELTHRKMKEADAILWIVGDDEPSAESMRDLAILRECSQTVVPIVNVIEDPTRNPPILRDDELVDEIVETLKVEFRHYFSPRVSEPLRVSSKVIALERAKSEPDTGALALAGYQSLFELLQATLLADASSGDPQDRLARVCGASTALISEAQVTMGGLLETSRSWRDRASRELQAQDLQEDEADDVRLSIRSRLRGVARERARELCEIVSGHARLFIEDTLQLTNITDLQKALKKGGKTELEEELQHRFNRDYLQIGVEPNWLTEHLVAFAEDVQAVVLPAWKRVWRTRREMIVPGESKTLEIDFGDLGRRLIDAIMAILGRVLGIAAVAAILLWIPGGAPIDAIGVVGLIILTAINDPLAGPRRRAVARARLQIETQEYEISNRLLGAAMTGSDVVEGEIREHLSGHRGAVEGRRQLLEKLTHRIDDGIEILRGSADGLTAIRRNEVAR